MHTIKCCFVVFGVTFSFMSYTSSSSSPDIYKLRRLPATSVVNSPWSVAAECISRAAPQHAMKPDIGSESQFLPTPLAFDAPVKGSRRNIAIRFRVQKLEWCGYLTVTKINLQICLFVLTEFTNMTDGRTHGHTHRHRMTA